MPVGDEREDLPLDQLGSDVDATIRSLRSLARGVHPPLLAEAGLADALRADVRELPLAVTVLADGVGRHPRPIETAAYFACLDAIQNAVRHSGGSSVTVLLGEADGELRFAVRDDGRGFDPAHAAAGTGLQNISDRLGALGGHAHSHSAAGRGTRVDGAIPTRRDAGESPVAAMDRPA